MSPFEGPLSLLFSPHTLIVRNYIYKNTHTHTHINVLMRTMATTKVAHNTRLGTIKCHILRG